MILIKVDKNGNILNCKADECNGLAEIKQTLDNAEKYGIEFASYILDCLEKNYNAKTLNKINDILNRLGDLNAKN